MKKRRTESPVTVAVASAGVHVTDGRTDTSDSGRSPTLTETVEAVSAWPNARYTVMDLMERDLRCDRTASCHRDRFYNHLRAHAHLVVSVLIMSNATL